MGINWAMQEGQNSDVEERKHWGHCRPATAKTVDFAELSAILPIKCRPLPPEPDGNGGKQRLGVKLLGNVQWGGFGELQWDASPKIPAESNATFLQPVGFGSPGAPKLSRHVRCTCSVERTLELPTRPTC